MTNNAKDAITVLAAAILFLLVARSWFADVPAQHVRLFAAGGGFAMGFAALSVAVQRIDFHRTDGALAAYALHPSERAIYISALSVAFGLLAMAAAWAVMGRLTAEMGLGLLAGGGTAMILAAAGKTRGWQRVSTSYSGLTVRRSRTAIGAAAGLGTALGLLLVVIPRDQTLLAGLIWLSIALVGLALSQVRSEIVAFAAQVGTGSAMTIAWQVTPLLAYLAPVLLAAALSMHLPYLVLGAGLSLSLTLLTGLRVLAARIYPAQVSELVVLTLIGGSVVLGLASPFLGPAALVTAMVVMERRARDRTWMLQ